MNDYAGTAGWARERLIAVRDATPAPGDDVTDLAVEVAAVYEELTAILPSARPTGDPREWSAPAVVKAGAAVIGVLDELRNPQGPGNSRDLPELFFAASVERTLTGSPAGVEAACVSALTGDAEQLWAKAFGKLLVYAISVPVVGLIDDLTGMLAEAVAARRWMNLQRQLAICADELTRSPDPGQMIPRRPQPDTPVPPGFNFRRRGPWRRVRPYGTAPPPSTAPGAARGPSPSPPSLTPPGDERKGPGDATAQVPRKPTPQRPPQSPRAETPTAPPPQQSPPPPRQLPKAVPARQSVTPLGPAPRRRRVLPLVPQVEGPTPPTPHSVDRRRRTVDHSRRLTPHELIDPPETPSDPSHPPESPGVSGPAAPGM